MYFRPYNDEATCDRDSNERQYPYCCNMRIL